MSLTAFLENTDVRWRFAVAFSRPRVQLKGKIRAPALSKRYQLVGTAFDYLLRFYVKHLNPRAIEVGWIATGALSHPELSTTTIHLSGDGKTSFAERTPNLRHGKTFRKIEEMLAEAKARAADFLQSGRLTEDLIRSSVRLAQLDVIARTWYIDPHLGRVHNEDVKELKRLMALVNPALFNVSST